MDDFSTTIFLKPPYPISSHLTGSDPSTAHLMDAPILVKSSNSRSEIWLGSSIYQKKMHSLSCRGSAIRANGPPKAVPPAVHKSTSPAKRNSKPSFFGSPPWQFQHLPLWICADQEKAKVDDKTALFSKTYQMSRRRTVHGF